MGISGNFKEYMSLEEADVICKLLFDHNPSHFIF